MANCIRSTNLLLLPGMMCDQRQWGHQLDWLGSTMWQHDDAPQSPCAAQVNIQVGSLTGYTSITKLAAQVLQHAPSSFALAGLSMGGIVAFEIWRQAPHRVERLALLDTSFLPDTVEKKLNRDRQVALVQQGHLETVLKEELKPNYLAASQRKNSVLLNNILEMGIDMGVDTFIEQSQAVKNRQDSTSTLRTIDCPTLVLCGEEDQLCPVGLHAYMATEIPDAELVVLKDCGHLSTMEQPLDVSQKLQTWLGY